MCEQICLPGMEGKKEDVVKGMEDTYRVYFEKLLECRNLNKDNKHLIGTPLRVAKAMMELTSGYELDPDQIISTGFDEQLNDDLDGTFISSHTDGQLIVHANIQFVSLCAHHLLPFFGYAHIGLLLKDRLIGLSKVARVVQAFSRRLQVQEELTAQIAQTMSKVKGCKGSIVLTSAVHGCMSFRGIKTPSVTSCSSVTGVFRKNDEDIKGEFLRILQPQVKQIQVL